MEAWTVEDVELVVGMLGALKTLGHGLLMVLSIGGGWVVCDKLLSGSSVRL